MRAVYLGNYFVAGCIAFSLLGWVASLHPYAFRVVLCLLATIAIAWGLSWLLGFSLSKLLKISVADLQALLIGGLGMLLIGLGYFYVPKLFVLSASSVVLWLTPLSALDKTVDIHKALQGVSLTAAIACAVVAGNIAREQAEQNEIEEIKTRAINADVVDEIATSAYISQQQRQQEAEQILNPREHLERSLALNYSEDEESESITQNQLAEPVAEPEQNAESERAERALQLKAKGWGKAKIILEVWGVSKGGSPKYKAAETEYRRLTEGG